MGPLFFVVTLLRILRNVLLQLFRFVEIRLRLRRRNRILVTADELDEFVDIVDDVTAMALNLQTKKNTQKRFY